MLPEGVEKRQSLKEYIDRGCRLCNDKDAIKIDEKALKDEVQELLGKDIAKDFFSMVKIRHNQIKIKDDAEKKLDTLAELEILYGE